MYGSALEPFFDEGTTRLIRSRARRLCRDRPFTTADRDDVEQELTAHLARRQPRFLPRRGSWTAFVACVLDRRAASLMRERRSQRRGNGRAISSLDQIIEDGAHGLQDRGLIDRSSVDNLDLRADLEATRITLPPHLQIIVTGLEVYSQAGLAKALHRTRRAIKVDADVLRRVCDGTGLELYVRRLRAQRDADSA